jgi:hypothetical protein
LARSSRPVARFFGVGEREAELDELPEDPDELPEELDELPVLELLLERVRFFGEPLRFSTILWYLFCKLNE